MAALRTDQAQAIGMIAGSVPSQPESLLPGAAKTLLKRWIRTSQKFAQLGGEDAHERQLRCDVSRCLALSTVAGRCSSFASPLADLRSVAI